MRYKMQDTGCRMSDIEYKMIGLKAKAQSLKPKEGGIMLKHIVAVIIASVFILAGSLSASLMYEGKAEGLKDGSYTIGFTIYRTQKDRTPIWQETLKDVEVKDGRFKVRLGETNPILERDRSFYLEAKIDGKVVSQREPISVTKLAWLEGTEPVGDITAVWAGEGLQGGGDVGEVELELDWDVAGGNFWSLTGNAGTDPSTNFLGTTDNQPLIIRVDNQRVIRIEPTYDNGNFAPNIIAGYSGNSVEAGIYGATIGGGGRAGDENTITGGGAGGGVFSTIGGGFRNTASGGTASIGGGYNNTANNSHATVGGGTGNTASGSYSTVGGGAGNTADQTNAVVGGGEDNTASGSSATVGGGIDNTASGGVATVSGGANNEASEVYATIGGGYFNEASGVRATVGGGYSNAASGGNSTVGGGNDNTANASGSTVGGGYFNAASELYATVAGGIADTASGRNSTIGGGEYNMASGAYATVPGGRDNEATGVYSFAAGRRAKAMHSGAFVWGDNNNADIASTAANQFIVRAYRIWFGTTSAPSWPANSFISTSTGAFLSTGGAWTNASDKNLKTGFTTVNEQEILEKVAELPITKWHYKSQDPSIKHIGPVAQDFYAAFGVGEDDEHLTTIDVDGVALASIQALYKLLKEKDTKIAELEDRINKKDTEFSELQAQISTLQQQIATLATTITALQQKKNGEAEFTYTVEK